MIFARRINQSLRPAERHPPVRANPSCSKGCVWDDFDWDRESGILGQSNWWFELDWDGVRARLGQRIWNPGTVKLVVWDTVFRNRLFSYVFFTMILGQDVGPSRLQVKPTKRFPKMICHNFLHARLANGRTTSNFTRATVVPRRSSIMSSQLIQSARKKRKAEHEWSIPDASLQAHCCCRSRH